MSTAIRGVAASPGAAVGPVFLVPAPPQLPEAPQPGGSADEERDRLHEALHRAGEELAALAARVEEEIGPDEAGIFSAQSAFASDPALIRIAEDRIGSGSSAEKAVVAAFGTFRDKLEASSEYLAARVGDLDDVRDRVVGILAGEPVGQAAPSVPSVVVAADLTPSQTAGLPAGMVLGLATEGGTATSHAAIVARALGVPAVVGVRGLMAAVESAGEIAVDGSGGEVIVDPDPETREAIDASASRAEERQRELDKLSSVPGQTADGKRIELAANIGSLGELEPATQAGAEGCGLVRTEFLFQERARAPAVDEQVEVYRQILDAFPGHRVVFRTLDIGADKPLPFVSRPSEANPALGVRGIRLGLEEPGLLRDQLRAIVVACKETGGKGAVMFPMVSRDSEVDRALAILEEVTGAEEAADLEVGIMVETPVAALAAGRLARKLGFVSVGTNDLLQYLFAADRLQAELADLPDLFDPAVLGLLAKMVSAVHAEGAWVGVCGEAAGSVEGAAALVGLGVDELSMSPACIPEVKHILGKVEASTLEEAVGRALAAGNASEARRLVAGVLPTN